MQQWLLDKDPFSRVVDEVLLSEKAKAIRDRAWEAISSIVILEPEIYYPRERAKHVKTVAQKYGLSEKVIYKYLKTVLDKRQDSKCPTA